MDSNALPEVLIVGGGPSGLILGLALLQNDIPVRIIEKNPDQRIGQRGAAIMPRSLELLEALGIIDDFLASAIPIPPVRLYELPGGVNSISDFEMVPRMDPTPAYPFLNVMLLGQDRLENLLRAALARYSCQVEFGTELVSFEQMSDRVEAKMIRRGIDPSSEGILETTSYEWLIGTDGARGVVRKLLGLPFLGETRKVENFVVGDIHVEGLSRSHWHMWGNATTTLISLRPTEFPTLFNFVIAGQNVDRSQLSSDPEALVRCLIEHTGGGPDLKFKEISWVSLYTPNIRMVEKFGEGRVFVAGDAGHVHSPTGGQGLNTGIQDSFNLAWKLALVHRKLAPQSLLQTYTEERIPVVAEMLSQTTKLLNNTFKGKIDEAWKRSESLLQLGVNYRWSSIIIDERKQTELDEDAYFADYDFGDDKEQLNSYGEEVAGIPRAGDRAPDASGLVVVSDVHNNQPIPQRLFEVYGPSYHTVLVFARATEQCSSILKTIARYPQGTVRSVVIIPQRAVPPDVAGADYVFEDRNGHAYEGYGIGETYGVVVVRPDGVVGAIVKGPEGLKRYFFNIFGSLQSA